eukprot:scpid111248/ scgid19004/ 
MLVFGAGMEKYTESYTSSGQHSLYLMGSILTHVPLIGQKHCIICIFTRAHGVQVFAYSTWLCDTAHTASYAVKQERVDADKCRKTVAVGTIIASLSSVLVSLLRC